MAIRRDPALEALEVKLEKLKRDYDQYFAGNRRREPTWQMREIERELLEATRVPPTSTMVRFQLRGLAQRFRSFQTQVRNIMRTRQKRQASIMKPEQSSVIIDSVTMNNPSLVSGKIRAMCRQMGGQDVKGLSEDALQQMLMNKAQNVVGKDNVAAIRYTVVDSGDGPKLRGEKISGRTNKDD